MKKMTGTKGGKKFTQTKSVRKKKGSGRWSTKGLNSSVAGRKKGIGGGVKAHDRASMRKMGIKL